MTKERKKWAKELSDKLEKVDGIEECYIGRGSKQTYVLIAHLRSEKKYNGKYSIKANLKSISQKIRHKVDNDEKANQNIVENKIISPDKQKGYYDVDYYEINVSYP
jgi:DNA-binding Lrp family transcriptional regulator